MDELIDSMKSVIETSKIMCNICSIDIPNVNMVEHVFDHYNPTRFSAINCNLCNESVNSRSVEFILEHMIYKHEMRPVCPLCRKQTDSMDDLYYHLQQSIKFIYHCNNQNCLWMSDKKKFIFFKHLKSTKHKRKLNIIETIFCCKFGEIKPDELSSNSTFRSSLKQNNINEFEHEKIGLSIRTGVSEVPDKGGTYSRIE